jgi:hypothetical protein
VFTIRKEEKIGELGLKKGGMQIKCTFDLSWESGICKYRKLGNDASFLSSRTNNFPEGGGGEGWGRHHSEMSHLFSMSAYHRRSNLKLRENQRENKNYHPNSLVGLYWPRSTVSHSKKRKRSHTFSGLCSF